MNIPEKEAENIYWRESVDTRKMVIRFLRKIWLVLLGIAAGIVAGILVYFMYHAVADRVEYRAVSEFYLDFAADETGEVYQYYNGYTWNDLMTTDLIATGTLNGLEDGDVDLSVLEADTQAEILSDIRVLRVTITDADEGRCAHIQAATENSLVNLGQTAKEFNDISLIKSTGPERIYADNRLVQAMELGGIIGLILTLIIMAFAYILDDRIYVPSDLKRLPVPGLGVEFDRDDDRLTAGLSELCRSNVSYMAGSEAGAPVDSPEKIYRIDAEPLIGRNLTEDILKAAGEADAVILEIPYGKVHFSALSLLMDSLQLRGVQPAGLIITHADHGFYRVYYGLIPGKKE